MTYSIKQVSELTNLTIPTIRYYEFEGLLPEINRDETGCRVFEDKDLEWLDLICCLRNTGMPIKKIRKFVEYALQGNNTIDERIKLLTEHDKNVNDQLMTLQHNKEAIQWKINAYLELKKKMQK